MRGGRRGSAAIAIARGEWLAFLDGDDFWKLNYLEKQLAALRQRNLDMIWSDGIFVGDTVFAGRRISEISPSHGRVTVDRLINGEINISNSSTVVRRNAVTALGGYDDSIRRGQDFDLWVRIVLSGAKVGYLDEPLLHYRVRSGNLTGDALSNCQREIDVLQCIRDKRILGGSDFKVLEKRIIKAKALSETILAKRFLVTRNYDAARISFSKARELGPTFKLHLITLLFPVLAPLLRKLYINRTPSELR